MSPGEFLNEKKDSKKKEGIVSNLIWFNYKFVFVFLSSKLAKSFTSFEGDSISDY